MFNVSKPWVKDDKSLVWSLVPHWYLIEGVQLKYRISRNIQAPDA